MGKAIKLQNKKTGENLYPMTASDMVFDPITKKTVKADLAEKIGDAPSDGKQYARKDGAWNEVESGSVNFLQVRIESNQDGDDTIEAVKATVAYDSTTVEISNGEFVSLPENVNVTISFPEVEGYKKPNDITFAYLSGLTFKSGIYQTELVKVELRADNDADVSGQVVTINGVEHTYGSTAVEQKIPFGTEYTVSVNDKSGYTTPTVQTFIASQSVRNLEVVYNKKPLGIFIQGISGQLYNVDNWSDQEEPNSIAIRTDSVEFGIAFSSLTKQIYNIDYFALENYMTGVGATESNAILDLDGYSNTEKLFTAIPDEGYAAYFAKNFVFPNGKAVGYIGSAGEWEAVIDNYDAIINAINAIGFTSPFGSTNWTSTFSGKYDNQRKMWIVKNKVLYAYSNLNVEATVVVFCKI